MISFYQDKPIYCPGETYFAEDGGQYYLVLITHDYRQDLYIVALYLEVDMPAYHRSLISDEFEAYNKDAAITIAQNLIEEFRAQHM